MCVTIKSTIKLGHHTGFTVGAITLGRQIMLNNFHGFVERTCLFLYLPSFCTIKQHHLESVWV